jgi:hypothetical protein
LYSWLFQFSIGSWLKVQIGWDTCSVQKPGISSNTPQLAVIITHESLVIWGCIFPFWKGPKILYHFHIVHLSWFCTIFSHECFTRSLSVQIWICIQGLTCVHCVPIIITYSMFIVFEKVSYKFGTGSFLRLCLDWTGKFKNSWITQIWSAQNFSSPVNFKKLYHVKRLSYQGVLITVGKMRKFSISFLLSFRSDSGWKGIRSWNFEMLCS